MVCNGTIIQTIGKRRKNYLKKIVSFEYSQTFPVSQCDVFTIQKCRRLNKLLLKLEKQCFYTIALLLHT